MYIVVKIHVNQAPSTTYVSPTKIHRKARKTTHIIGLNVVDVTQGTVVLRFNGVAVCLEGDVENCYLHIYP